MNSPNQNRESKSQAKPPSKPLPDESEQTLADVSASIDPGDRTIGDQTVADGTLLDSKAPSQPKGNPLGTSHTRQDDADDDRTLGDRTMVDSLQAVGSPTTDDTVSPTLMDAKLTAPKVEERVTSESFAGDEATMASWPVETAGTGVAVVPPVRSQEPSPTMADHLLVPTSSQATELNSEPSDDHTQMETAANSEVDRDQTIIESSAGAESFDPESTRISQEDFGKSRSRTGGRTAANRRDMHETAGRWESQQRYQLVNNFARGGLGQIWMANDNRLRREVAYKEMLPAALANRPALERFLEEAQITGQLEHPGIVPIYDIGYQANGAPFYAMKLVRGETFEKHIAEFHELPKDHPERPLRFRKLLRNFIDICNALAFAHDRGVLHRDLKPLNVMIGAFGETLVLDWGLAKVIEAKTDVVAEQGPVTTSTASLEKSDETMIQASGTVQPSLGATQGGATVTGATQAGTMSGTRRMVVTDVRTMGSQTMMGSVMGTPAYMPPEQALGKLDELDARSDIYSLGGILYKLLTNQQPIEKGKIQQVLDRVINNTIIPPTQHDSSLPGPLSAICLKALAGDRNRRYASALLLAADVEAWMGDEPVSCFEDPWPVKLRRWAKRHRTAVTSTVVAVGLIVVGWSGAAWLRRAELNRLRVVAQAALSTAETAANQLDFKAARQTLIEAVGRVADKAELAELKQSLESRMALFEERRLDALRRTVEAKLEAADGHAATGNYDEARAALLALQTQLADEASLSDQHELVARQLKSVEEAIGERVQIAQTQTTFEQFRRDVDAVRARGSLLELEDIDDDAKQALATGLVALKAFELDQPQPLARQPKYFEPELLWVKQYQERKGQSPSDVLRDDTFETLLIMGEMEVTLARNQQGEERKQSAERALMRLAQAESLGVKSLSLLARQSDYFALLGKKAEADQLLAKAQAMQAETALDNFLLGEALRKQSRYQDALGFYLKAQQQDPNHYWVQHCTGLCYLQLHQPVAATSCFSTCIAMRPTYVWPHMLRGFCYAELKDFDSAYRDFDRALSFDGTLYNVFINRGAAYLRQQRFEEALKDFQKAAELKPEVAKPLINIAVVHREVARRLVEEPEQFDATATAQQVAQRRLDREAEIGKRLERALAALAEAAQAERAPAHPAVHQLRASIFEMQSNDPLAMESLQKHIQWEREPERIAASHNSLGKLYSRQREHQKALDSFSAANALQPKRADVVYQLGETHLQLGHYEAAIRSFQQFQKMVNLTIEDQITNPELLYSGIATAYDALGKKHEAIEYYTLSLVFDRSQAVPLTKRGWSYVTQAHRLAQKDFEEATKLNPDNPDSWTGLAYVQSGVGAIKEALVNAQRAAELTVKQANDPAVGTKAWPLFFNVAEVYGRCHQRLLTAGPTAVDDLKSSEQLGIRLLQLAAQLIGKEPDQGVRQKLTRALLGSIQGSDDLRTLRESAAFKEVFKPTANP